jgi:hypothetical protein
MALYPVNTQFSRKLLDILDILAMPRHGKFVIPCGHLLMK